MFRVARITTTAAVAVLLVVTSGLAATSYAVGPSGDRAQRDSYWPPPS